MAWVKIESSVSRHRKMQQAGPAASWLWICGLCYCQEGLTDGFIPFEALPYLGVKSPSTHVSRLVRAGLWDHVEGGWRIHDYLEHNKPASEVRRIQGERRRAGSEGGRQSGHARRASDEAHAEATAEATAKQVASATAKQTANPALTASTATATATDPAVRTAPAVAFRPAPLIAKRRGDAAFEGPRVYITHRQHRDFIGLRNHPGAEAELFAWYEQVSEDWTTGAHQGDSPGSDMFQFWRARFDERWPPQAKPQASGRQNPVDAWLDRKKAEGRA